MLAVFIQRGRADAVQFTPRQRRFEQVRGIHRPIGLARADKRVHFVDEQDDLARRRGDFGQDRFQPFLELTTIFRTGNQRAHIERHQLLVAQGFRHVAIDDPQRQPFGNRGFTDAGFTDQNRVVLGPTATAPASRGGFPRRGQ